MIYLTHHLSFLFPRDSLMIFSGVPQKLPRCSLSPVPGPLPPGKPEVFITTINLSCTKLGGLEGRGDYSRGVYVECYMISHHLLSDKLLVCQAFVRYSVFMVTRDIHPNSGLQANLEENLCLTFIYT